MPRAFCFVQAFPLSPQRNEYVVKIAYITTVYLLKHKSYFNTYRVLFKILLRFLPSQVKTYTFTKYI